MPFLSLLRLTFREIRAKKIVVGVFVVSTLAWVMLAFALNLDVVEGGLAAVKIFGSEIPTTRDVQVTDPATGVTSAETRSLIGTADSPFEQFVLAAEATVAGAAYWVGLLLALFATSSLVTGLLERGTVDLTLSKPLGRAPILLGRLLGILLAVLALYAYLMGMVWIVMSVKSGFWNARFLISIGVIVAMFAVMYGVVTLVSVATQSSALALIVTYGLIFASIVLAFREQLEVQIHPPWRQVFVGLYHLLPNFAEVTALMAQLTTLEPVESWYPLGSSLAFGLVMYACAFMLFVRKDF